MAMSRHASRRSTSLRGFIVPVLGYDDLYTIPESGGPSPGVSEPLEASGFIVAATDTQAVPFDVKATSGTAPASTGFAVRVTGDSDWLYWSTPNHLNHWLGVYTGSTVAQWPNAYPRLATDGDTVWVGGVVVDHMSLGGNTEIVGPPVSDGIGVTMVYVIDGTVYHVHASSDTVTYGDGDIIAYGSTWVAGTALGGDSVANTTHDFASIYQPTTGLVCAIAADFATSEFTQVVSADRGATWSEVVRSVLYVKCPSLSLFADGTLALGCISEPYDYPTLRRWASAGEPFSDGDGANIVEEAADEVAICVDDNDYVYAFVKLTATPDDVYVFVSVDRGETFVKIDEPLYRGLAAGSTITGMSAVPWHGEILLGYLTKSLSSTDYTYGIMRCGGWSMRGNGGTAGSSVEAIEDRKGSGASTGGTLLPIDLPHNVGWTLTGGVPPTIDYTSGEALGIKFVSAAVSQYYSLAVDPVGVYCDMEMSVGGSQSANQVLLSVTTATRNIGIRYHLAGFRVIDLAGGGAGTVLASVTIFGRYSVCVYLDKVYYRETGDMDWLEVTLSGAFTAGAFAPGITFGHRTATATSHLYSLRWGTAFNKAGAGKVATKPVALPEWLAGSTRLVNLGGYAALDDEATVTPRYAYDVRQCFPDGPTPSQRDEWRTEQVGSTVYMEFHAPASAVALDSAPALYVGRTNVPYVTLEARNTLVDAWTPILTLDLAVNGALGNARGYVHGNTVRSGIMLTDPDAARYLRRNELADGGWLSIDDTYGYYITRHTPGTWGTDQSLQITYAGEAFQETDSTPALFDIPTYSGSGYCVALQTTYSAYKYWRLAFPASTKGDCPDFFVKAGAIVVGYFAALGRQWSNGMGNDFKLQVTDTVDERGRMTRNAKGPPRRVWALPYADGARLNTSLWVGEAGKQPLATLGDVSPYALYTDLGYGAVPCVAVRDVVSGVSVTDPDLYLYGYLGDWTSTHVTGPDGPREYRRGGTLTVTEA